MANSFFQLISQDEYKVQLYYTMLICSLYPPPISKKEKYEEQRIRNNLKMRASQDCKKAKKIVKKKQNLKRHIIKPTQNAFDVLSQIGDGSVIFYDNLALTTNYS